MRKAGSGCLAKYILYLQDFCLKRSIHIPPAFQSDLLHDAFLIVVAKGAAQLVVVHGWTVLLDAPQPGHLWDEASKHKCL